MNNSELNNFLYLSGLISSESDIQAIVKGLKVFLPDINEVNIFYYDYSLRKLKDVINNFSPIEEMFDETAVSFFHGNLLRFTHCDFVIDSCEVNLTTLNTNEEILLQNILFPLRANGTVFGMIEINMKNKSINKVSVLKCLNIFSNQLLLWIQNRLINDKLQVNADFYSALKNIAKIIETQYELNYIIPLIGEMIDKFVSNHLIYIFLKQKREFKLFWPNSCRDKAIYDLIGKMNKDKYIISDNRKIGVFPLADSKEILGCIVAHSTIDKLTPKDIEYISQLTKQSSVTIERANIYSEVLKHATLDALTNLNNRRQFEIRLRQEYASAKRRENPLCTMMIDIDFFKSINDTYGHAMGDKVLKSVAKIIKQQLREYDIPSRYGGEEFCILLPQTRIEEANIVAQRLRAEVESTVLDKNSGINVTISIGLSQLCDKDEPEDLYKKADKALYKAKERGRNRVVIYHEEI